MHFNFTFNKFSKFLHYLQSFVIFVSELDEKEAHGVDIRYFEKGAVKRVSQKAFSVSGAKYASRNKIFTKKFHRQNRLAK